MARHRKDTFAAAHGYAALFRGERSAGALVAGMRLSTYVEHQIAFIQAHAKKR